MLATVPVATVCANAGGPPSVAAATYGVAGTSAATELEAFSTKPPQFYLEAVSFWLKRLRFFLALRRSELVFLSHPFDFTFPGFEDALSTG